MCHYYLALVMFDVSNVILSAYIMHLLQEVEWNSYSAFLFVLAQIYPLASPFKSHWIIIGLCELLSPFVPYVKDV